MTGPEERGRDSWLRLHRRHFLLGGAGGLLLGFGPAPAVGAPVRPLRRNQPQLSAFLRITSRGVTVIIPSADTGQGIATTMAQVLAEDLDCDWSQITVEPAPLHRAYVNPLVGRMATPGSASLRAFYLPLRQAGATARLMLMGAAAKLWRVPVASLVTAAGFVIHPASDRRASYLALSGVATRIAPPTTEASLRPPASWRLAGRSLPRMDLPDKLSGKAVFGADVRLPEMVWAAIRHCPVFGGQLGTIQDHALRDGKGHLDAGLIAVVPLKAQAAVAVVAESWWQANGALGRLAITWNDGARAGLDDAALAAGLAKALDARDPKTTQVAAGRGEIDKAFAEAARVMEGVYRFPLLVHALPEPMTCTVRLSAESCEVWAPTQNPGAFREILPPLLGLKPEQITLYSTALGGGFGRRMDMDAVVEAALIAREVKRPVQLLWSREEDLSHDFFRPASLARVSVALDGSGRIAGWRHRLATALPNAGAIGSGTGSGSAGAGTPQPGRTDAVAPASLSPAPAAVAAAVTLAVEGVADQAYALPAVQVEHVRHEAGLPTGRTRGGGHTVNTFAVESMIDEVAAAVKKNPLQFRRDLLTHAPRALRVLDAVTRRARWDTPLTEIPGARRGRGLALHEAFGSVAGLVAEVTVHADGRLVVDGLVAVMDCGFAVNPAVVAAQGEGAILYGLSDILWGRVFMGKGRALADNFDRIRLLTLAEAPPLDVLVLNSDGLPGGATDITLPPLAPALANAIFAATGRRLRTLPLSEHDLRSI